MTVSPRGDRIKNWDIISTTWCLLPFFDSLQLADDERDGVVHHYHGWDEQGYSCDGNINVAQGHGQLMAKH